MRLRIPRPCDFLHQFSLDSLRKVFVVGGGDDEAFAATDDLSFEIGGELVPLVGDGKGVYDDALGNDGVTGLVKSTPNAIGYVELAYASQNKLTMASLRNHAGQFIKPSVESVTEAAAGVALPPDYRVSITDAAKGYPVSSFTYLLVYKDAADTAKGTALLHFLWWSVHDGQKIAPGLDYAPLPAAAVQQVEATLKTLTVNGKAVLVSAH